MMNSRVTSTSASRPDRTPNSCNPACCTKLRPRHPRNIIVQVIVQEQRTLHARIVGTWRRSQGPGGGTGSTGSPIMPCTVDVDKAICVCRQAGTRAFGQSAYQEAVAFFEQARAALTRCRRPALRWSRPLSCPLISGAAASLATMGAAAPAYLQYRRRCSAESWRMRRRLGNVLPSYGRDTPRDAESSNLRWPAAGTPSLLRPRFGDIGLQMWSHFHMGQITCDLG